MTISPFFDGVVEGDRESGRRVLRMLMVECGATIDPSNAICDKALSDVWLNLGASGKIQVLLADAQKPVPMRLPCPTCGAIHVDEGEFATKPHHTHACQECGEVWRPAVVATVGVRFLPGFKNP